jgi:solute carrier family 13 (sodium-dependent dicarboxylate transporter), member 2/3/5
MKTFGIFFIALVLATIAYSLMPAEMPELAQRTVAIFLFAAILWATEVIPLYATSLCVVGLEILLLAQEGGLAGQGGLSYHEFLSPFASGVIILFMGGFLLGKAVTKHGLDHVLARRFLYPFVRSRIGLVYGIMLVTAFFSMWISNTATCVMMFAILSPILASIPKGSLYGRTLVLAVAFGANIGGIGTPIGTPPNAICLANLRDIGLDIGFLQWMTAAIPLMVLLIAIAGFLLLMTSRSHQNISLSLPKIRKRVGIQGWLVSMIVGMCGLLWMTSQWHGINEAVIALIAAALLTALRILDRKDVDSIDWNILILMWGGLSLSHAMQLTHLSDWLGSLSMSQLPAHLFPMAFVLLSVTLSTLMSNTAAANLIIPIAVIAGGSNPLHLAVLSAFACSFAMALPISTPPNAMAFATGGITARQMLRSGGIISLVCILALALGYQIVLPLIFK